MLHSLINFQWQVEAVQDQYIITFPGFPQSATHTGIGPVLPGFGLSPQKYRGHNELVKLTVDIARWDLTEVDAKYGIYK